MLAVALVIALAVTGVALALAWRATERARAERLAARLARAQAEAFVESVRRLGFAARRSVADVRAEIDAAVRRIAPAVDSVLLFDDADGDLRCSYASGERVAYFDGARVARSDRTLLPALALQAGHRVVLGDGMRTFHPGDAFALAVPLPRDDGGATVLYAAAPAAVDAAQVEALVALGEHAAFAYALAGERDDDRRRAAYDALTGLLAPRALRERLATLVDRARASTHGRLAVLFVDTDNFKTWNDTYGHASGDALLRAIARTLQSAATGDDLAARNGGDEFCVVFVDCEKSAAIRRADAIRAAVAAIDVAVLRPAGVDADVRVTASIGVATLPADADDAAELLRRADAAMYHVKRSGRDGVAYAEGDGAFVRTEAAAPVGSR